MPRNVAWGCINARVGHSGRRENISNAVWMQGVAKER